MGDRDQALDRQAANVRRSSAGVDSLGFDRVGITRAQVWAVRDLPFHHRDPFDRLLVVQAQELGVPLITADTSLSAYDVGLVW